MSQTIRIATAYTITVGAYHGVAPTLVAQVASALLSLHRPEGAMAQSRSPRGILCAW